MNTMRDNLLHRSHWGSLRDCPRALNATQRAQSRKAWGAAVAAYENATRHTAESAALPMRKATALPDATRWPSQQAG